MYIDGYGLAIFFTALTMVLMCLFVLVWWQDRANKALLWWATSYASGLTSVIAFTLLARFPDWNSLIPIGLVGVVLALTIQLHALRCFFNRPNRLIALLSMGGAVVLVPYLLGGAARGLIIFEIWATAVTFSMAWILLRDGNRRRLMTPQAAAVLLALHGLYSLFRVANAVALVPVRDSVPLIMLTGGNVFMIGELILFVLLSSMLFLVMSKERELKTRLAAESAARQAATDYRLIADHVIDVIVRTRLDGSRVYVSPSSQAMLGWAPEELLALNVFDTVFPEDLPNMRGQFKVFTDDGILRPTTYRMRKRDGQWLWVESSGRKIRHPVTGDEELVVVIRDISIRKGIEEKLLQAIQQLEDLAVRDGLTDIVNRRGFDTVLRREWRRALRMSQPLSLIMLDIDWFKSFNDVYGHPAGDNCLRRVAEVVTKALQRPGDVLARYGGEEFAIILPQTGSTGASVIAETVRQAVAEMELTHSGSRFGIITVSVGYATVVPTSSLKPIDLIEAADRALYQAKETGRNRISHIESAAAA